MTISPAFALEHSQNKLFLPATAVLNQTPFVPYLVGLSVNPEAPFKFDAFIRYPEGTVTDNQKKSEYQKLIKYFLASLTVPDKDQWVNLSPYEKGRIIEDNFGKTEMGRDLLAQDYMLKQISSSLMNPNGEIGKEFWKKVYMEARKHKGTGLFKDLGALSPSISMFNKIWIVPDEAVVYEKGHAAYIVKSHLKVMMEKDYLASNKIMSSPKSFIGDLGHRNELDARQQHSGMTNEIIREFILPELEREVNEGKAFANLRQIVSAMTLATWYKQRLKESILGKAYADRSKIKGTEYAQSNTRNDTERIYQSYLAAFKKGAYNLIKEESDPATGKIVPRKYFSGGFSKDPAMVHVRADFNPDWAQTVGAWDKNVDRASVSLGAASLNETLRLAKEKEYIDILKKNLNNPKNKDLLVKARGDLIGVYKADIKTFPMNAEAILRKFKELWARNGIINTANEEKTLKEILAIMFGDASKFFETATSGDAEDGNKEEGIIEKVKAQLKALPPKPSVKKVGEVIDSLKDAWAYIKKHPGLSEEFNQELIPRGYLLEENTMPNESNYILLFSIESSQWYSNGHTRVRVFQTRYLNKPANQVPKLALTVSQRARIIINLDAIRDSFLNEQEIALYSSLEVYRLNSITDQTGDDNNMKTQKSFVSILRNTKINIKILKVILKLYQKNDVPRYFIEIAKRLTSKDTKEGIIAFIEDLLKKDNAAEELARIAKVYYKELVPNDHENPYEPIPAGMEKNELSLPVDTNNQESSAIHHQVKYFLQLLEIGTRIKTDNLTEDSDIKQQFIRKVTAGNNPLKYIFKGMLRVLIADDVVDHVIDEILNGHYVGYVPFKNRQQLIASLAHKKYQPHEIRRLEKEDSLKWWKTISTIKKSEQEISKEDRPLTEDESIGMLYADLLAAFHLMFYMRLIDFKTMFKVRAAFLLSKLKKGYVGFVNDADQESRDKTMDIFYKQANKYTVRPFIREALRLLMDDPLIETIDKIMDGSYTGYVPMLTDFSPERFMAKLAEEGHQSLPANMVDLLRNIIRSKEEEKLYREKHTDLSAKEIREINMDNISIALLFADTIDMIRVKMVPSFDQAMESDEIADDVSNTGGIDLTQPKLKITGDDSSALFLLPQIDEAQLSQIEGLNPSILSIEPVTLNIIPLLS